MRSSKSLELAVGVFVALGLAALLMLALRVSDFGSLGKDDGYRIVARFENIGGLKVRAPVSVAGVRIGRVVGIAIDQNSYQAVVTLAIASHYQLPKDSSASVLTAGLLGEQYVGIEAGGDEAMLKAGDEIKLTQSALVLERLIGQFLFKTAESKEIKP